MRSQERTPSNSPHLPAIPVILGCSLSIAATDVAFAIRDFPVGWIRFSSLLPRFAVTALLSGFGLTCLWFLARTILKPHRGRVDAFLVTGVTFAFTAFFFLRGHYLLTIRLVNGRILGEAAPLMLASLGVSCLVYLSHSKLAPSGVSIRFVNRLVLLAPFLFIALASGVWSAHYDPAVGSSGLSPAHVLPASASFIAVVIWVALGSFRVASRLIALLFLVSIASGAWAHFGRTPYVAQRATGFVESAHPLSSVVLITVDTLRSDVLSSYNPHAPPTPNFDRLAASSVVFRRAYSSSSWTLLSIASLMTGVPTLVHGMRNWNSVLPAELPTLAEQMRDAGYLTAAIVENPLLNPQRGLFRGFQEYAFFASPTDGEALGYRILLKIDAEKYARSGTEVVTAAAESWLREHGHRDHFLWIHYYDPHVPYSPPKRFLPHGPRPQSIGSRFESANQVRGGRKLSAEERSWIRQLYLGETSYVDEQIGKLIGTLKALGLYDGALVVLTSDHGEEFWEHGSYEHGHSVYEEVISVPLMLKLPDSEVVDSVKRRVSNRHTGATILELAGVQDDTACNTDASLASLWLEQPVDADHAPILATTRLYYEEREAVLFDNHKLIRSVNSGREELYDLVADPREVQSLWDRSGVRSLTGRNLIESRTAYFGEIRHCYGIEDVDSAQPGPKMLEQLRGLGYIQ